MSNPHSPQQESGRREVEGIRLVLPDAIKSVQLASLQLHGSEKASAESLPTGQGAPCPAGHSFKCRMKLSIPGVPSAPFQSHANLAAHGLCHVSELHQMLWSLVMEPVTKVPTATPTYGTRLANRLHGTRASVRTPCEVGTCLGVRSFGEEDAVTGGTLVEGHCPSVPRSAGCISHWTTWSGTPCISSAGFGLILFACLAEQ